MLFLSLNWTPKIGDPSTMGWITVAFYFVTSALSLVITLIKHNGKTALQFWGILAIFLLLLGINKLYNIQSLFTEIGRALAKEQRWYTTRHHVQFLFIIIIGLISFSVINCWWMLGNEWKKFLVPITSSLLLITFIITRAVSFHDFEVFLKSGPAEVRMNWILELVGIGGIFFRNQWN